MASPTPEKQTQFKPNLKKAKTNVNSVKTTDYENKRLFALRQNKPNSNPKQTQFKPNFNPGPLMRAFGAKYGMEDTVKTARMQRVSLGEQRIECQTKLRRLCQ